MPKKIQKEKRQIAREKVDNIKQENI